MRFRLLILHDPDAEARGFNLRGTRVPLISFCPSPPAEDVSTYDGRPSINDVGVEYWKIPIPYLFKARPDLRGIAALQRTDFLYVPTKWCDVAPIIGSDAPYYDRF